MDWLSTGLIAAAVGSGLMVMILGYLAVLEPQERSWRFWTGFFAVDTLHQGLSAYGLTAGTTSAFFQTDVLLAAQIWLFLRAVIAFRAEPVQTRRLDIVLEILVVWELTRTVTGLTDAWSAWPLGIVGGGVVIVTGWGFLPSWAGLNQSGKPVAAGRSHELISLAVAVIIMAWGFQAVFHSHAHTEEEVSAIEFIITHVLAAAVALILIVLGLDMRNVRVRAALAEAEQAQADLMVVKDRMTDFATISSDWFWEQDADLRFTYVLLTAGWRLNWQNEDVVGKTRNELDVFGVSEEQWTRHDEILAAREPLVDFRYELLDRHGDQRVFSVRGMPIFDEADEFQGYRGVGSDITDMIRAESRAKAIHGQLLHALESRSEGIAYFDAQDRFVICNAAYRVHAGPHAESLQPGMTFEDYVRSGVESGLFGELRPNDETWLEWRLSGHRSPPVTYEFERDEQWFKIREQRTDDGGSLISTDDITELKAREKQLREAVAQAEIANRAKMEFLATMSHELRTPLNAIIGFSEILGSDTMVRDIEHSKEYAGYIHESGAHLLSVINDLLDVARIETGKLRLEDEKFSVGPLFEECDRMVRHRAIENGLDLRIVKPSADITVLGDRRAIKQVFLNLLSNAIKFTRAGGRVELRCGRTEAREIEFTVADNGIGVPLEKRAEIFQPFRQVEHVHVRTHQGTGLGLFISKNLVEAHDGSICLGDNPIGQGTAVRVTLPKRRVVAVQEVA